MATPENTFIGSVHKHLPLGIYHMKNHNQYIGGVADCWYSGPAHDWWVEYKFIQVPVRDGTIINLVGGKDPVISHLQQDWLKSRFKEGRDVAVIVGSKDGGVVFFGTAWRKPISARTFRDELLSRPELAEQIRVHVS